jgi:uncharacterized protein DUF4154
MKRRRFILLLTAVALTAALRPSPAPADEPNEYKVKAALIAKFIQFVEWPDEAEQKSIVVATVGRDPFDGALEQFIGGRHVAGKPVIVKHFGSASEMEKCQVLFVPADSDDELAKSLRKQGPVGMLTVGETDRFLSDGGVIRIFTQGGTMRFEISQEAAARGRLQISAKLLRLAKPR